MLFLFEFEKVALKKILGIFFSKLSPNLFRKVMSVAGILRNGKGTEKEQFLFFFIQEELNGMRNEAKFESSRSVPSVYNFTLPF